MSVDAINIAPHMFPWWGTGILYAFSSSLIMLVNQQLNARPSAMMVWRGLALALVISPFLLFVTPPNNSKFYALSFIVGCLGSYFDNRLFTATSKFGAGIISRIIPLSMILSFFAWFIYNPAAFFELIEVPFKMSGIVSCLLVAMLSILAMKKNHINKDAIVFIAPAILAVSMIDVLNKSAMILIDYEAVVYHMCLASFVTGVINLGVYIRENKLIANGNKEITHVSMTDTLFSGKTVKAGLLVVLFMAITMSSKGYSMQTTPNPGYVSAIGYSSPLFILAFNKIKGVKDEASVLAGMILVASIVCMIVLVS
ncbi:MAG: hypothetical protein GY804_05310 [Alphaproteobacteria bacterium]|nr:hypothetical protein [Alphaproteobacteria bacterium]